MRILIDTNILFSAILFPRSKPAIALLHVVKYHSMILCDRNIYELRDILSRKAPHMLADAEVFSLDMERPRTMTATEFLAQEKSN